MRDGNIYLRRVRSKNGKPYFVPIAGELLHLIERRKQARSIETDSGVLLSSLVFHRSGEPILEFRKSWATDSMFSRYNVTSEEDLRNAMQKVTEYNEAESQEVVTMEVAR